MHIMKANSINGSLRVTIPLPICKCLNIRSKDLIAITVENGIISMKKVEPQELRDATGHLPVIDKTDNAFTRKLYPKEQNDNHTETRKHHTKP